MRKLILLSLVAMSILVARDCRYEEQELNMLIQQYEDLKDEADYLGRQNNADNLNKLLKASAEGKSQSEAVFETIESANKFNAKYNFKFNRLNKRIEQQKQRLNNCRNGK